MNNRGQLIKEVVIILICGSIALTAARQCTKENIPNITIKKIRNKNGELRISLDRIEHGAGEEQTRRERRKERRRNK